MTFPNLIIMQMADLSMRRKASYNVQRKITRYSRNTRRESFKKKKVPRSTYHYMNTTDKARLKNSRNIKTHKKSSVKICSFSCYTIVQNNTFNFKGDRYKQRLIVHINQMAYATAFLQQKNIE